MGMAMDLSAITLINDTGKLRIDLTDETQNKNFYDAFRNCWDRILQSYNGGKCTCSIGYPHTHPPSNELHKNHMHVSLCCPPQTGVAGC